MTRLADQPPLTLALAFAAGAGSLVLLAAVLPDWISTPIIATAGAPRLRPLTPAVIGQPPMEDYASIMDRPLFNPGRKKDPPPPSQAAAGALPSLTDYRVVGIVVSRDSKFALVEQRTTKQVQTLHVGDAFDGRHVDDILETGVALSSPSGPERLAIPKANGQPWESLSADRVRKP